MRVGKEVSFMPEGKTIGQLMEEMRQKAGAQNYHGHDYMDLQRFAENTQHIKNNHVPRAPSSVIVSVGVTTKSPAASAILSCAFRKRWQKPSKKNAPQQVRRKHKLSRKRLNSSWQNKRNIPSV